MKFTQTAAFKKLQTSINTNNALRAELQAQFTQGEATFQRSLNEVKASLMDMVETFNIRAAKRQLVSTSDISTSI